MGAILGIDVGTTGTKTVLMDDGGEIITSAYKGYGLISSGSFQVEQDTGDWWEAIVSTVRKCMQDYDSKQDVEAIALSTQGATLVAVDEHGFPLSNAVVWMDTRAGEQGKRLNAQFGENYFYHKTGWRAANCFNFLQILWMKENAPELFSRAFKFLSTVEYINYKLSGVFAIDQTNAGITQLYNIADKCWDKELLEICGIDETKLSTVIQSGETIGELTHEAADELGLPNKVKLISGAHDQYCASVGIGAVEHGDVLLSCGTSWGVMGISDKLIFNDGAYFAPGLHAVGNLYGLFSYTPAGGAALEWFRNNLALNISQNETETFSTIDAKIHDIPVGAEDVFFFPHLAGTSCPTWSDRSRGTIMGLDLRHTRYHIAKACMEGVVYDICWMLEKQKEKGFRIIKLKALGGAAKSREWMQMASDILGVPIVITGIADIPAVGAAIIAGFGAGLFKDFMDGFGRIKSETAIIEPDPDKNRKYIELFTEYKRRFELLKECYLPTQ